MPSPAPPTQAEPTGSLAQALAHTERLLAANPALAAEQAGEILKVVPANREAILLLAAARAAMGDLAGAEAAHLQAIEIGTADPLLIKAALALREHRLSVAETLLRDRLKAWPTDVAAIRMLAEVAAQIGRYEDSANLLSRCLELYPGFHDARRAYAQVLLRHERPIEALAEADRLMAVGPKDVGFGMLKAAVLSRLGDQAAAGSLYEDILRRHPGNPKGWMSYGHVLKTLGRAGEGVDAYRRALAQAPHLGEVWWSLANLKTFRFDAADVTTMRTQLARRDLDEDDRMHLHFALGKALEDEADYQSAFEQYRQGNAIRHAQLRYEPKEIADQATRAKALFTPAFFAERDGVGCPARDPIFVVGLPRSGSTLVEQILASHSQVEGTAELPDITSIVRQLGGRSRQSSQNAYPDILATLSADELAALGEQYLDNTRVQRKTARPLFVDKLPNNWMHVGLIQLILPSATIIDVRRHPLGCCLSGFKQHFARGQAFSYDLTDIGLYYRDYVDLMAHFDAALPGRVHRVSYERMIADTEGEVRRLLDYVGLPFEASCLEFWTNDRAVRTASSEQVRQPIFGEGVDHWRHFEPWLGPLKTALGPVLESYAD